MADEPNFDPAHFEPGLLYGFQSQPAVEYCSDIGPRGNQEILGQDWQRRLDDADTFVRSTEAGDRIYKLGDLSNTMVQIRDGKKQVEVVDIKGNKFPAANLTIQEYEREKQSPERFIHGAIYSNTGFAIGDRWSPLWRTAEFTDWLVPWQFKIRLAQSWKKRDIRDYVSEKWQMHCFARTEEDFLGSSQYKDLLARLRQARGARSFNDRFKIRKIVCFALGSPVRMDMNLPQEPRIQRQHVQAIAFKEEFGASACYAEDPEYSSTDKKLLGQKGMKVVEDPDGFREIDNDSLVFFINPNTDIWAIMADNCRPAIIICYPAVPNGRLPAYDKYKEWTEEHNPEIQYQKRVRYMAHKEYDKETETRWDPETWRKREWLEEFTK